jgi:hypothetical protein
MVGLRVAHVLPIVLCDRSGALFNLGNNTCSFFLVEVLLLQDDAVRGPRKDEFIVPKNEFTVTKDETTPARFSR